MGVHGGDVAFVVASCQQPAMNFWMQGLDPAVHHFRESGMLGDFLDGDAGIAERLGGTAGGQNLDAMIGEIGAHFGEARFV